MRKKYLLRFTPLEPYFLGGENTFRVNQRSKYFAASLPVPSATTVLGTLRYLLLELNGALNSDGKYTPQQQQVCDALIGPKSYCVGGENKFGKLLSVSPVFLTDGEAFYIKTPLNCKVACLQTNYQAMELGQQQYATSFGCSLRFPLPGNYSAKDTVSEQSYMRLSDGKILNDLFLPVTKVGITKGKPDQAFFKKTYYSLKKGFSFAVIAEFDGDLSAENTFCHMGREKSPFLLQATETDLDIESEIKVSLAARSGTAFYYVFGDTFVQDPFSYSDFALVQTAYVRMLRSDIRNQALNVTCSDAFYQLLRAGSVLYGDDLHNGFETNMGYNKIINIEV